MQVTFSQSLAQLLKSPYSIILCRKIIPSYSINHAVVSNLVHNYYSLYFDHPPLLTKTPHQVSVGRVKREVRGEDCGWMETRTQKSYFSLFSTPSSELSLRYPGTGLITSSMLFETGSLSHIQWNGSLVQNLSFPLDNASRNTRNKYKFTAATETVKILNARGNLIFALDGLDLQEIKSGFADVFDEEMQWIGCFGVVGVDLKCVCMDCVYVKNGWRIVFGDSEIVNDGVVVGENTSRVCGLEIDGVKIL